MIWTLPTGGYSMANPQNAYTAPTPMLFHPTRPISVNESSDEAATSSATTSSAATSSATVSSAAAEKELPGWVESLVYATDSRFRVPGTSYRFGYDALLGLLPGIGDAIGSLIGMSVLYAAYRTGAPKRVMMRMLGNLALDAGLGIVPVFGDYFDFAFKANRKNLDLLKAELARRGVAA